MADISFACPNVIYDSEVTEEFRLYDNAIYIAARIRKKISNISPVSFRAPVVSVGM